MLTLFALLPASAALAQPATAADPSAAATPPVPRDVRYPVRVTVDASGAVTDVAPLNAVPDGLQGIVERAARRARFEPAMRNEVPVPARVWVTARVGFQAKGENFSARVVDVLPGGGVELSLAPTRHQAILQRGRGYNAVAWTQVVFDAKGRVDAEASQVQRVDVTGNPGVNHVEEVQDGLGKLFKERIEESLVDWRWTPDEVDGTPIGGTFVLPVWLPSAREQASRIIGADTSPDPTFTPVPGPGLRAARLQPWRTARP